MRSGRGRSNQQPLSRFPQESRGGEGSPHAGGSVANLKNTHSGLQKAMDEQGLGYRIATFTTIHLPLAQHVYGLIAGDGVCAAPPNERKCCLASTRL
jgi:hypothetical protein